MLLLKTFHSFFHFSFVQQGLIVLIIYLFLDMAMSIDAGSKKRVLENIDNRDKDEKE